MPVNSAAEEGLGGLGEQLAADAGITDRRASVDSATIQLRPSRFQRDGMIALPALNTHATIAKEGFDGRRNREGAMELLDQKPRRRLKRAWPFWLDFSVATVAGRYNSSQLLMV